MLLLNARAAPTFAPQNPVGRLPDEILPLGAPRPPVAVTCVQGRGLLSGAQLLRPTQCRGHRPTPTDGIVEINASTEHACARRRPSRSRSAKKRPGMRIYVVPSLVEASLHQVFASAWDTVESYLMLRRHTLRATIQPGTAWGASCDQCVRSQWLKIACWAILFACGRFGREIGPLRRYLQEQCPSLH